MSTSSVTRPSDAGPDRIEEAIRAANRSGRAAVVGFLTGGYPGRERFPEILVSLSKQADVIEVGVPFSDPMADGVTIQRASEHAIREGVTLDGLIRTLGDLELSCPALFMSYLNPVLQYGYERFAKDAAACGIDGLIVPDLPLEESEPVAAALEAEGLGLVQLVTPVTPADRLRRLTEASRGFVYAVTRTGTTGAGHGELDAAAIDYLERVRAVSPLPVLAGFGIRTTEDVQRIGPHVDGVIVGSAVIESLERGEDPAQLLWALKLGGRRQ